MNLINHLSIVLLLVIVLTVKTAVSQKKLVCYHTNWSQYRPDTGKFFPENIDANLCTHIIYSFAKLSNNKLEPYEWNDLSEWSVGMYERAINLKKQNSNLKILIAVGGWNHGSGPFSEMVHNNAARSTFVSTSVEFLKKHKFDGLDLDWEYPGSRDSSKITDRQLFTILVAELKQAFQPHGFLLTAAVGAGKKTIDKGYEIDKISKDLDWINLMAYDFHGSWEAFTGFNAPLYGRSDESGEQAELNVDWAVNYWLSKGAPKEKLILGMGSYGRSFRLTNANNIKAGDASSSVGSAGTWTREGGFLSYYEICQRISQGWKTAWSDEQRVPYIYNNGEWVGYDDVKSLKEKVDYLKIKGLGGAMFWALDLDDFSGGMCGQGRYPLINSVKQELNSGIISQSTIRTTISTTTSNQLTTSKAASTTQTQTTTNAAIINEKCKNGDGYYQDTDSKCQRYYICAFMSTAWAQIIYFDCANGLMFDATISACNIPSLVKCETTQTTTTTKSTTKLSSLVTTTQSTTTTTTTTKQTTAATLSTLTTTVKPLSTITTTKIDLDASALCVNGNGFIPDYKLNCKEYYLCVFANTPFVRFYKYQCPDGFQFDKSINACNKNIQCGETTTTTKSSATTKVTTKRDSVYNEKCSKGDGVYADKESGCSKYYECIYQNTEYAKTIQYQCPEGTIFNMKTSLCDWSYQTTC